MEFKPGARVRSSSGVEGRVARPNSSADIQRTVRLSPSQTEDTYLVVTGDGEVRRFLESALEPVADEIRRSGSLQ